MTHGYDSVAYSTTLFAVFKHVLRICGTFTGGSPVTTTIVLVRTSFSGTQTTTQLTVQKHVVLNTVSYSGHSDRQVR